MLQINKEDLIKKYIDYKIDSYKVGFSNNLELDRVEKILNCHGWLQEAEEAFKSFEDEIKKKREILKDNIIEALKDYKNNTVFELNKKIELLKEEVVNIDRFGFIRIEACREFFESVDISFLDKAQILMKLGEIGVK